MAVSNPTIARGIGSPEMNSSCRSKMSAPSASKPTMKPALTSSPARVSASTASPIGWRRFWVFPVSRSDAAEGVSMPTKTSAKPAATIAATSSGTPARSTLASVMNWKGKPWARCQRSTAGRSWATCRRFPTKLSSTKKRAPLAPRAWSASSSATTCSGDLVRGTRPKISTMSQNSQRKGQPREYWSAWLA